MLPKKNEPERFNRRALIYVIVGVLFVGLFAFFALDRTNYASQLDTCKSRLTSFESALMETNTQLITTQQSLKSCEDELTACKLDKLSLQSKYNSLEKDYNLVVEFFIRYDQIVAVENFYATVETCDDFLANYPDMITYTDGMLDFLRAHGTRLMQIFNDDLARNYGYEQGLSVPSLQSAVYLLKSNIEQTYEYCTEG